MCKRKSEEGKNKWGKIKELTECVKNIKAAYSIMTGDFNEDVFSKKIQEFVIETGVSDVFDETTSVGKQQCDPTFEW